METIPKVPALFGYHIRSVHGCPIHSPSPYAVHLMKVKVLVVQSFPTLCSPMDWSPPDFSVHGILQARILEGVAVPFSRGLLNPGIKPESPELQEDSLLSEPPRKSSQIMQWLPPLMYQTQGAHRGLCECSLNSIWRKQEGITNEAIFEMDLRDE